MGEAGEDFDNNGLPCYKFNETGISTMVLSNSGGKEMMLWSVIQAVVRFAFFAYLVVGILLLAYCSFRRLFSWQTRLSVGRFLKREGGSILKFIIGYIIVGLFAFCVHPALGGLFLAPFLMLFCALPYILVGLAALTIFWPFVLPYLRH